MPWPQGGSERQGAGVTVMLQDVKRVWVVQCKSTGHFLSADLCLVRSLRQAGKAPDLECALETGRLNFDEDFEVFALLVPVGDDE